MNHEHIKRQVQGYRDMQGLAYDEIDVHTLLGEAIETIEALSAENREFRDYFKARWGMDDEGINIMFSPAPTRLSGENDSTYPENDSPWESGND
jgi:hypothetical protein